MAIYITGGTNSRPETTLPEGVSEQLQVNIIKNGGSKVRYSGNNLLFSFSSVDQVAICAAKIIEVISENNLTVQNESAIRIGLSAGVPLVKSQEIFGEAVQLAWRLTKVAGKAPIIASSQFRDLFRKAGINAKSLDDQISTLTPSEEKFLNELMDLIEKEWNNPSLDVRSLVQQTATSKSQLYRKTIALTGFTPKDFIKEYKLQKARDYMDSAFGNISQIAFESGFSSPSYFSKVFQKRFGISPSEYMNTA
jgi:AraC-like DNA-binding protein